MLNLALLIGWLLAIFIGALELIIVFFIVTSRINIANIISDENGDASMSRFQFLIFTFVVAMSLFYLIIKSQPPQFPVITPEVLALLGISGASYVISKAIQANRDTQLLKTKAQKASAAINGITGKNGSDTVIIVPQVSHENRDINSAVSTLETNADKNSLVMTLAIGNLQKGASGKDVYQLQQRLHELEFYLGSINGIFDEQTEFAVKAFQVSEGLADDGIVGPSTLEALGLTSWRLKLT
ncbi:peptidoglycan-binding domain-containing protein [Nostoc sp. MG11]|uniref:peptidoglycan-binding domain-containing protein n=1 Tax=Nostoc sp. MG11 TaxID=2721166 RepID=UPI0018689164|nr:peptidoglycan-binding protein [Nostoc sp. MG11]